MRRHTLLLSLFLLTLLAGFFRFYHLHALPLGLYHDEGMNGNDAVSAIRTGEWKIFYPANGGREGLFINLQAVSIMLFGATPWALRAVSGLMGVLTVLGLYLLVRDLYDERHAMIAGVLQSVLIWPVIVSRLGLRVNLAAAILVWMLWALLRAYGLTQSLPQRRIWFAVLSGVLLGLGFHSYISFRIIPLLVAAVASIAWKQQSSRLTSMTLCVGLIATLIASPLLIYFVSHPGEFASRTQAVSIFATGHPIYSFLGNIAKEAMMCFYRGDLNWRHNYSSAPMLFWGASLFLLIGVGSMISALLSKQRSTAWREQILVAWLVIGSLPGLLSAEAFPHGLRLLIVAPVLCIIASIGLIGVAKWIHGKLLHSGPSWPSAFIGLVLAGITCYEYRVYFYEYANKASMKSAFAYDQFELAQALLLGQPDAKRRVIISNDSTLAYGIPLDAQGFAFITQTLSVEEQSRKNIHYAVKGRFIGNDSEEYIALPAVSERGY